MRKLLYLFTLLFCSILFAYCGSINKNLKEEMQKIKEQLILENEEKSKLVQTD